MRAFRLGTLFRLVRPASSCDSVAVPVFHHVWSKSAINKRHIQFFFTISLFIKPQISLILDLYTNFTPTDVLWCAQSHVLDCFPEGSKKKLAAYGLPPPPWNG